MPLSNETKRYIDEKFAVLASANAKSTEDILGRLNVFIGGLKTIALRQKSLEEENSIMKFQIKRLQDDVKYLQGKERAANLVIQNCGPEKKNEAEGHLREKVFEVFKKCQLSIEVDDIVSAKRLGEPKDSKVRPLLIVLSEPRLKNLIFPASRLLREKFGIFVNNDYTPAQREELYNLRVTRRKLKERGYDCRMKGFELIIEDVPYNWQAAARWLYKKTHLSSKPVIEGEHALTASCSKRKAEESPPTLREERKNKKQGRQAEDEEAERSIAQTTQQTVTGDLSFEDIMEL